MASSRLRLLPGASATQPLGPQSCRPDTPGQAFDTGRRTMRDEQLCHLGPALEAGTVHGRVAVALTDGGVRTGRQQRLDRLYLVR